MKVNLKCPRYLGKCPHYSLYLCDVWVATWLVDRRKQKKNIFMYKIKNNKFSECMTSMFNTSKNNNYNLRNNDVDFPIPKPNTNFLKRSISYSGVNLWNGLPKCAKEKQISIAQFKVILNRENCR